MQVVCCTVAMQGYGTLLHGWSSVNSSSNIIKPEGSFHIVSTPLELVSRPDPGVWARDYLRVYRVWMSSEGSKSPFACWSVFNRDQDSWSAKTCKRYAWLLDSLWVKGWIICSCMCACTLDRLIIADRRLPWSLDQLSKRALITWFNFDPGRKHFYTGHLSDYPMF